MQRFIQQNLEYFFKHALTQEVVYNGLLKKERRKIHESIGSEIEIFEVCEMDGFLKQAKETLESVKS